MNMISRRRFLTLAGASAALPYALSARPIFPPVALPMPAAAHVSPAVTVNPSATPVTVTELTLKGRKSARPSVPLMRPPACAVPRD